MGINQMNAILSLYGIEIDYTHNHNMYKEVRVYHGERTQTHGFWFEIKTTNAEIVKRLIEDLT